MHDVAEKINIKMNNSCFDNFRIATFFDKICSKDNQFVQKKCNDYQFTTEIVLYGIKN